MNALRVILVIGSLACAPSICVSSICASSTCVSSTCVPRSPVVPAGDGSQSAPQRELNAPAAAAAQVPQTVATSARGDADAAARTAILRRDPRALPRSATGAWAGFDPAHLTPQTLPPEMGAVTRAIVAGDMVGALGGLYALLDRVPEFPPALHMMGIAYFRLQRYGDSAVVLARYVELVPHRIGDTRVLGHDLYSLGRYAEARAHYERVVAAVPNDAEAWRGLALSTWRLGDGPKALELLERVLALDPEHDEAWAWKAQILFDEGRDEEALEAATRARELEPHESRTWFVLGRVLTELGRADEAQAAIARFRELDLAAQEVRRLEDRLQYAPRDVALIQRLIAVHASTGNSQQVRTWLPRLVAVRPDDLALRVQVLDVLDFLDDRAAARTAARDLESRAHDDLAAWRRLHAFYERVGDEPGVARAAARLQQLDQGR